MCLGRFLFFFFFSPWSGDAACINWSRVPRLVDRSPRWQPSSSITLIFHNNMKNTVHCRGLMNCIFRVTLAFLMKVDEFPWAGQLCLNWCRLCQGTSVAELKKNTNISQSHKSSFGLSDNFSKNIWFKVWHLSSSVPGLFILFFFLHPYFLHLMRTRLLAVESIQKAFLTFVCSCCVTYFIRSDNRYYVGWLSHRCNYPPPAVFCFFLHHFLLSSAICRYVTGHTFIDLQWDKHWRLKRKSLKRMHLLFL